MSRRILLGCAALAVACLLLPELVPNTYAQRVINLVGLNAILALGLDLVVGYTGLLALGHAAFFGIGAYASALLMVNVHWPFWPALAAATLFTGIVAALLGFMVLRLSGTYLAMATIAFNVLVVIVFNDWDAVTRGPSGIPNIPAPQAFGFTFSSERSFYFLILAGTAVSFLALRQVVNSPIGRAFVAMREDMLVAESLGINTAWYSVLSFSIAGLLAGIAGSLYASYLTLVAPTSFTVGTSLTLLSMVVIGGRSLWGALAGAAVLTILPEIARPVADYRLLLTGAILVLIMIFRPTGLAGARRMRLPVKARRVSLEATP
jgi:branched-chain amino acid transport system permease protein